METLNPLFKLIRDFFTAYLPNERKCSPNTIRSYQKALELLLDYTKDQKHVPLNKVTFCMIDRKLLSEFLDFLEAERKCSVSTRNHRLNCIRAFYNYAAESDISAVSYWEEIKKVDAAKAPEQLIKHMSETAVDALLAQPNVNTHKGLRDMFLMLFLYKTGARIQEALDVQLCDVQFGKYPKVTLNGKGSKPRNVPLRDNVAEHMQKYINLFHPTESKYSEQPLFYVTRRGAKKRMTEDNARNLVRQYGASARITCPEVPENVYPHLLRHSFAMCLYQNGVDLTLVSQWLGHSDLETTLIYAKADTEMKRKAMEKSVPDDSPLKRHINLERLMIDNEGELKKLCGLK